MGPRDLDEGPEGPWSRDQGVSMRSVTLPRSEGEVAAHASFRPRIESVRAAAKCLAAAWTKEPLPKPDPAYQENREEDDRHLGGSETSERRQRHSGEEARSDHAIP